MASMQSGFADIADARLYYELAGSGPDVVLLHGFSLDTRIWDAQFAELAANHRVLRYDLRGFGRSAPPVAGVPYSHSRDLHQLLDHLGIGRACVVGLSMGGWIATHFALTQPRMTRALALVDAALIGCEWSAQWKERWRDIRAAAAQSGIAAAKQRWLRHPVFEHAARDPARAARIADMVADYSGWHWLNPDPHEAIDPPDMERLHEITAPTLVVTGALDMPDFHLHAQIFERAIARVRNVVVPGAGHLPNFEEPALFNRHLREFLSAP